MATRGLEFSPQTTIPHAAGRIVGLFNAPPFSLFRCPPFRYSSQVESLRVSLYAAFIIPSRLIPTDCSSVQYASINDAVSVIKKTGAGCFMAKTDVKTAFRLRPIHPNDCSLLNMKW